MWFLRFVSAATALWLVAQLYAGVERRHDTWPIVGFNMFSGSPEVHVEPLLIGTTADGEQVVLDREDFGLRPTQWAMSMVRNVALNDGTVHAGADEKLGRLAGVWAERTGTEVDQVVFRQVVTRLDAGQQQHVRDLVTWSR